MKMHRGRTFSRMVLSFHTPLFVLVEWDLQDGSARDQHVVFARSSRCMAFSYPSIGLNGVGFDCEATHSLFVPLTTCIWCEHWFPAVLQQ